MADSALYTKENLKELEGVKWVTRVPETIGEAKEHILALDRDHRDECGNGYWITNVHSSYGEVAQRWLIVFSEKAFQRENATLEKKIEKATEEKEKQLWHLGKKAFACKADAVEAAKAFEKKLRYHRLIYRKKDNSTTERKAGLPHPMSLSGRAGSYGESWRKISKQ